MISLMGNTALYFALFFAVLQSALPLYGYYRRNPYLLAFARVGALGQCFFIVSAYLLLTLAFITNDFYIAYVANHSHPSLPLFYRLGAVWGGHEGSILLWILMLNAWTLAYNFVSQRFLPSENNQLNATLTLSIFGFINICFLSFLLLTSNPFLAASQPFIPHDLNPLLQDPGLVIHPPMLYAGYVGFSAAFALTLAALLHHQLDTHWAHLTRLFALAAWCFLTLGITLGSWWAYRVLGWGGFWFWDPVENASLLPWLSGTALIHTLVLVEKRGIAKNWAALLAMITFALSLVGTFLVRSGLLISAHTFANDPARGVFLLILLAILLTAASTIYVRRLLSTSSTPAPSFYWLSRETALLLNSALFFVAMLTVLLGTLYPLIFDALEWGAISVGAPYFNKVMLPLVFITLIVMSIGPLCLWQKQSLIPLWSHLKKKFFISLISACLLLWCVTSHFNFISMVTLTFCFCVMLCVIDYARLQPGMTLAHVGFATLIIGIILSSTLNQERDVRIRPGNAINLGPYQFFFIDTQSKNGPNYHGIRAAFEVIKNQRHITNLYPEKRIYNVREMVMTKVAIHPGIFRDLYIALGEPLNHDDWSVRFYYKPFIRWIWLGGLLMILGGLIAMWPVRKKSS